MVGQVTDERGYTDADLARAKDGLAESLDFPEFETVARLLAQQRAERPYTSDDLRAAARDAALKVAMEKDAEIERLREELRASRWTP